MAREGGRGGRGEEVVEDERGVEAAKIDREVTRELSGDRQ